ncbi:MULTISPECIES: hypothetical protein [Clostridium]|uniref:hypothetical protein n=1 Tax=Clostridium TaxID=1485 RepID=UPI00156EEF10|nr:MULTISPECIES: hypothetical protein [Clostridium]NSB30239.1 seryl-tRNA synthetase [Clostridium saccharoperbutylacetonicum]
MKLVNDNINLLKNNSKIKKLDIKLSLTEIKECMYKYKSDSMCKTDIEINEYDGITVLLKGSSDETIETDWKYFNDIVTYIVNNRKEDVKKDTFKNECIINERDRNYTRPYEILASDYVNQYSNGRLYITGHVASLMDKLDKCILEFAKQENAIEFYSEPLWYEDELEKFGYSKDNENLFKINKFDDRSDIYWQNAVCDNIWESLENKTIDKFTVYSSLGVCSRTERNQTYFFERMNVFHMREIVAVGEKENVIKFRERAIQFVIELSQKLKLNFSLEEASDPFFIEDTNTLKDTNSKLELPEVVKVEFRPHLYDNKSLACASFNVHGNFFVKKFNYMSKNNDENLWTSCIAFGLERWCWAILVQFGTDVNKWPEHLKSLIF